MANDATKSGKAPIIVKKVVKGGGDGHHGGAWKVAYADFVTAMMAFFLLMWLLNATSDQQRSGLADYFSPDIPISPLSAGGRDVLNGDAIEAPEPLAGGTEAPTGTGPAPETPYSGPDPQEVLPSADAEAAADLAEAVAAAVEGGEDDLGEHFVVHTSPEGLVIEIVDRADAALFASGSAAPGQRLERLIGVLVPVLARTENRLKVVGHTDSTPFSGGGDNWRLSTERALVARRLMAAAGLEPARLAEVAGKAATDPLMPDPRAPQNRRIAVTLLSEGRPAASLAAD